MNLTGIIPFLNIAGTARHRLPLILAVVAYVTFVYAGMQDEPEELLEELARSPGRAVAAVHHVTPLEFLSTFILRPVTLTLRLLMNMVVGHMLLVLCFSATQFFFFTVLGRQLIGCSASAPSPSASPSPCFELFVAVLQAYVFTILTAVYIQLAVAEEH